MEAIKTINTNVEFKAELETEVSAVVELNDLQLAYVGGGSGDVGLK